MVKQKPGKAGFCTCSGCCSLCPLPVERKCHLMSPLCPQRSRWHHWGPMRWVPVLGQHCAATALAALQHPQMSPLGITHHRELVAGSSEPAYFLCFEKAQHSLTEFNIMPETSTAEAQRMGKSPAFLSWPRAGPWEDYSGQELYCGHHLLWRQCHQPLGRTLLPLLQPRAGCSSA